MKPLLKYMSAVLVLGAAAPAAAEGLACISDAAQKTLTACPNDGPKEFKSSNGKAPEMKMGGVAPVEAKKKDGKPTNPGFEQGAAERDDRKSRLANRAQALLVDEIGRLEALYKATGKGASDRAQIMRRLAEDYVELENVAFRNKTQAEIDRDALKKSNPAEAGKKQALVDASGKVLKTARRNAINYYSSLKNDYPNYAQLDEILYYLAYEYEQANDYGNARTAYYELINKRPDSKYIPNAYLAFGELFFNEAQGDPSKWDTARQAYEKVTTYPEDSTKVWGYAWYKLAYVHWNTGAFEKSLDAFKKTIDHGVKFAQQPNAAKLADAARRDIIPVYALQGQPNAAFTFFKNISGDAPGQTEKTYKMMDDLGQNYLDTGHYNDAIALYKDLLVRNKGSDQSCSYQAHITEAVMALNANKKDVIKNELDAQLKAYSEFKAGNHSPASKSECASKTAALETETAMSWHLEAVGSGGKRGTNDPKAMALAAAVYKKIVDTWTQDEFKNFEFPRITREDWPSIYKIKYAMADLLYFQNDWEKCGPAFDSVVAENPTGPEAPEAAYAAVLCYQNIYEKTHPKELARKGSGNGPGAKKDDKKKDDEDIDSKLKPKDMTESQKGMVQAFNRFTCYIKPSNGDADGMSKLVEVKYARSRTYFEAQHWEEAAVGFRDIALNNADQESGIYAAMLYMESINVLGTHGNPTRSSCFADMAQDVPKFIDLYCKGDKATKNAESCTELAKVQVNLQRLGAEAKVKEAASLSSTKALSLYEEAGVSYMDMFKKNCQDPAANGQPASADRCDEIAYNAAKAYQAARLVAKSIGARKALIEYDRNTKGNSPYAKKAIYEIGGNYQAIAVYDKAADYYEQYADADVKGEKADLALSDAVLLRLGLGQEAEALRDAEKFRKNYGASKQSQTASIAFAIGAHYAEKGDWDNARKNLSGNMSVIDKASPDIQVQAHATLGRVYAKIPQGDKLAKNEYAKVRNIWGDGSKAVEAIRAAHPGDADKAIGKALNAVGEAIFYNADEMKVATVDQIKFPIYVGNGDMKSVKAHIDTKVKGWLEKKKPAIEKAEAEYKKIVDLQPAPPPKWVIAAGSRVGLMWGNFVDEFRAAPIPSNIKSDAELRGAYYDGLDGASEPIKSGRAKPALQTCLTYSVKFQYFDDYSRSCEVWLAKNYKGEYHVVDELRGAPTLVNSTLDEQNPPLLIGGQFWHPPSAAPEKAEEPKDAPKDAKTEKKADPKKGGR